MWPWSLFREPATRARDRQRYLGTVAQHSVDLCAITPIKHVAAFLDVGWDVVKGVFKEHLTQRLKWRSLRSVRPIAVDEFATNKGHRHMQGRSWSTLASTQCRRRRARPLRLDRPCRSHDPAPLRQVRCHPQSHALQVLSWFTHSISTGPLEGLNNKIKVLKRQAYGFRDVDYCKLRLYFIHEATPAFPGCSSIMSPFPNLAPTMAVAEWSALPHSRFGFSR